jgi:hypothetical protein
MGIDQLLCAVRMKAFREQPLRLLQSNVAHISDSSKEEPVSSVKASCDYALIGDYDKVIPLDIFELSN